MEAALLIAGIIILLCIAAWMRQSSNQDASRSKPRPNAKQPGSEAAIETVVNKAPFDADFHGSRISIIDERTTASDFERAYRLATPGMTPPRREKTIAYLMRRHACNRIDAIKLALDDLQR